jgi:hypothetical protein
MYLIDDNKVIIKYLAPIVLMISVKLIMFNQACLGITPEQNSSRPLMCTLASTEGLTVVDLQMPVTTERQYNRG